MPSRDDVEAEVERRLEVIREDPDEKMKYDRNGDGIVDDEEWEFVRRQLRSEIQSEWGLEDAGGLGAGLGTTESSTREGGESPSGLEIYPGVLDDRFELEDVLGAGSQGRALLARDRDTGLKVVVKHLALGEASDWKAIELFEREGEVLENLDHPDIPDYVAFFTTEFEGSAGDQFFLVQEFVEGRALEARLDDGERWGRDEAVDFLDQMFDILGYLQDLNPPVVHRDIKASNVVRRPDGDFALIDFGAVQSVLPEATGSSTVIGTGGYVPPEQLMGRSQPASDLYATGATVLHAMTGEHPANLPRANMKFRIDSRLDEPAPFVEFLRDLTHPVVEERLESAEAARDALGEATETIRQNRELLTEISTDLSDAPGVEMTTDRSGLEVELREKKWMLPLVVIVGVHAVGFVGAGIASRSLVTAVLALPWALIALLSSFGVRGKRLACDRQELTVEWRPLGIWVGSEQLPLEEIDEVVVHDGCVKVLSGVEALSFCGLPSSRANEAVKTELDKWLRAAE